MPVRIDMHKLSMIRAPLPQSPPTPCSPAFRAGKQAYRDGVVVGDNPHESDTNEHWEWMCGWSDAGITAQKAKLANKAIGKT